MISARLANVRVVLAFGCKRFSQQKENTDESCALEEFLIKNQAETKRS